MSLTLFPDLPSKPNVAPIGNGYSLEKLQDDLIVLYHKGEVMESYSLKNGIAKRVLVVNLVNNKKATKSLLAIALGISRQSIDDWLTYYKRSGYEGLISSYKGSLEQGRKAGSAKLSTGNKSLDLQQQRQASKQALLEVQPELDFGEQDKKLLGAFDQEYEEEENHYGGSFVYYALLEDVLDLSNFLYKYLGSYSLVIRLFLMMQINRIGSLEQLKVVYKTCFGRLLGVKILPSRPVLNQLLGDVLKQTDTIELKDAFISHQITSGLVCLEELYLDGHFIPYTGKALVKKGFHTQHRQMEPGQTELYIHDKNQQIVSFDLQEGKGEMLKSMQENSSIFSKFTGGIAPLWVVDREIWGVNNFLQLANCRFITWEKHSNRAALQQIPVDEFETTFSFNGKSYRVCEQNKCYTSKDAKKGSQSIELRRIVLWNVSSGKRVAMVGQDDLLSTQQLAQALLKRWGRSENSFKHMGTRINMHYNPGRSTSELSSQQDIANPAYRQFQKQISQTKADIKKVEVQLGRAFDKHQQQQTLKLGKAIQKRLAKKQVLQQQLMDLQQSLQNCPPRVALSSVKTGAAFQKLKVDAKNLWDLAGSIFWNSRKGLEKQLAIFLSNPRDLLPVLEAITTGRAWVSSTSTTLFVRLEALETPRFLKAQVELCQALNEKNVTFRNGKILHFSVKTDKA